jgi:hypothetical protein
MTKRFVHTMAGRLVCLRVSATLWLLCTQSSSLIRGRKSATFWHDASLSVIRAAVDLTQGHTFFAPTPMM